MGDARFADDEAARARTDQQLGRNHGAVGGQWHTLEQRATEQAKCAIDIAHDVTEKETDQQVPAPAIEATHKRMATWLADSNGEMGAGCGVQESSELAIEELVV